MGKLKVYIIDRKELLINHLRSRIKSLDEMINLLKDYNKFLKERNINLEIQIEELKSGHFCCLETNCPNRVVQRIRSIVYGK